MRGALCILLNTYVNTNAGMVEMLVGMLEWMIRIRIEWVAAFRYTHNFYQLSHKQSCQLSSSTVLNGSQPLSVAPSPLVRSLVYLKASLMVVMTTCHSLRGTMISAEAHSRNGLTIKMICLLRTNSAVVPAESLAVEDPQQFLIM